DVEGIARRVHRDVHVRCRAETGAGGGEEQNDREPRVRRRVEVAAWVTGELQRALVEEIVDVERAGERLAARVEVAIRGVDGLEHDAVADAEALIRRLELRVE